MAIVLPGYNKWCQLCLKDMPKIASFSGPNMWHYCQPTCKHREFVICPDCWRRDDKIACNECGCEELYT